MYIHLFNCLQDTKGFIVSFMCTYCFTGWFMLRSCHTELERFHPSLMQIWNTLQKISSRKYKLLRVEQLVELILQVGAIKQPQRKSMYLPVLMWGRSQPPHRSTCIWCFQLFSLSHTPHVCHDSFVESSSITLCHILLYWNTNFPLSKAKKKKRIFNVSTQVCLCKFKKANKKSSTETNLISHFVIKRMKIKHEQDLLLSLMWQ